MLLVSFVLLTYIEKVERVEHSNSPLYLLRDLSDLCLDILSEEGRKKILSWRNLNTSPLLGGTLDQFLKKVEAM